MSKGMCVLARRRASAESYRRIAVGCLTVLGHSGQNKCNYMSRWKKHICAVSGTQTRTLFHRSTAHLHHLSYFTSFFSSSNVCVSLILLTLFSQTTLQPCTEKKRRKINRASKIANPIFNDEHSLVSRSLCWISGLQMTLYTTTTTPVLVLSWKLLFFFLTCALINLTLCLDPQCLVCYRRLRLRMNGSSRTRPGPGAGHSPREKHTEDLFQRLHADLQELQVALFPLSWVRVQDLFFVQCISILHHSERRSCISVPVGIT